jgi:hypothetical protein
LACPVYPKSGHCLRVYEYTSQFKTSCIPFLWRRGLGSIEDAALLSSAKDGIIPPWGRDPADEAAPDLFSTEAVRDTSPRPTKRFPDTEARTESEPQRRVLPKNLPHAVKHLSDGELDELVEVVFDEAKRRGRPPRNVEKDLRRSSRRPSDLATKTTPPTHKRRQAN